MADLRQVVLGGDRATDHLNSERHDAWTEGKEVCVLIGVTGVKNYAKRETRVIDRPQIGKR
jgi:hypothetical protein